MLRDYNVKDFKKEVKTIFTCYNINTDTTYQGVATENGIFIGYDIFNEFMGNYSNYGQMYLQLGIRLMIMDIG